jgi:exopolysaccharide production protein ExoY
MTPLSSPSADALRHSRLLRAADVALAFLLILAFSPIMIVLAFLIWATSGGRSPLYGHRRYGKDGRTFLCYKFKSMAYDADARLARLLAHDPEARAEWLRDHKLRSDPRVTKIGRVIRKTSLDELPQLFNILRGEMSLVGPRPIVAAEVGRYGKRFEDYCSIRPGITGIWQISGRNDTGYRRRVAMDSLMAKRMSPALYARILVGTARSVLTGHGAY